MQQDIVTSWTADRGAPRLAPLGREEYRRRREAAGRPVPDSAQLNISRTWAHSPGLAEAQAPLQRYLFSGSALSPRLREIAILRVGWRCRSRYEFAQHVLFARSAGLTDAEIGALAGGDAGPGWSELDRLVLDVVDELHAAHDLTDETWDRVAGLLPVGEVVDLLSVIGRYWTVSVVANALRLDLEQPAATALAEVVGSSEEPT